MEKDQIKFSCVKSNLEDYMTTVIYVNGVDLKQLIEKIEIQQISKKGINIQNGCYEGIYSFIAFQSQNHFLCTTLDDYIYDNERYAVYDYKYSGIPGDHSIACKIAIGVEEVIWYDFKNYSKIIPFELDYGKLQFHFEIDQYLDAINAIKKETC